ncbi:MAG: hypothetical protein J7J99_06280 [Thermoprotei archaeon]|nr:hypothetical protein [Thermoprotei archaeon]
MSLLKLIQERNLIYVGKRKVVVEGNRYKIYLPSQLNELWEELSKVNTKVEVFIRIKNEERGK